MGIELWQRQIRTPCAGAFGAVLSTALLVAGCQTEVRLKPVPPPRPTQPVETSFQNRPPAVESAHLRKVPQEGRKDRVVDVQVGKVRPRRVVETLRERPDEALLEVRFDASERRIGKQVVIETDEGALALRDDGRFGDQRAGDRMYSAIVREDLGALRAQREKLAERLRRLDTLPAFDGRIKLPDKPMQRILPPLLDFQRFTCDPAGDPTEIDPERSLVIRDPRVVEDPTRTFDLCAPTPGGNPTGEWTFGHLMKEMCNESVTGINPSEFVRKWLREWENTQAINDFVVVARPNIRQLILQPWEQRSGGPGLPLDLAKAPFRLLAIVNRVDLRNNSIYGGTDAGEGRFVFGALGPNCEPLEFTVIFEYGVNKRGCRAIRAWGKRWADLSTLALGSPAYNSALAAITREFTSASANPTKPNGSALNQLRTNEIALGGPWELREFVISGSGFDAGHLRMDTVKQTPDITKNQAVTLADFINSHPPAPLVPLEFPSGHPFLAGAAPVPSASFFWDGPATPPGPDIVPADKRFEFSFNTCNGCHAGETQTGFTHIKPRSPGVAAALSAFFSGVTVADPADTTPTRTFEDMKRRQIDLAKLVDSPCCSFLFFRPLLMEH